MDDADRPPTATRVGTPHFSDDHLTIYTGDVRDVLPTLPAESVHCVVTSPPYWGLRDYGTPGQLGLEPTPEEYVANLVGVFREVRRALRADGTVWLNLGDSYASSAAGNTDATFSAKQASNRGNGLRRERSTVSDGLKSKDLVGIPWRVAFALQADGWYLRSDIIWSKPNPMPESVTDRPTKAHEYVFLLSKSARYFYDADAVREANSNPDLTECAVNWRERPNNGEWPSGTGGRMGSVSSGRNLRSVWTIATQPYPGAHFATFPEKLVEPCVKAGTSERGVCPECGAPWSRVVERAPMAMPDGSCGCGVTHGTNKSDNTAYTQGPQGMARNGRSYCSVATTTGWRPGCDHTYTGTKELAFEPKPATVLDPFAGSGTTARVANRLGRRAVLIELNPDYIDQALTRNAQAPLGLVG